MLAAREGDTLRVETAGLRLLADIGTGFHLRRLDLVGYNRTIARAGLLEAGAPLALVKSSHPLPDQAGLVLEWSVGDPGANHVLCLRVSDGGNGGMVLQPVLRNGAGETWCPPVRWPCLGECTVSPEPADAWYLVGTDNTMLSNEPVSVTRPYGSPWPLPLIDLFAPAAGGGLAIWMEDEQLLSRVLEFKQAAGRADLSVRFDELQVRPGEALRLPAVHLVPHRGDWHEGFADYRRAAQRRWPAPLPSALAGAFYCRRDYPLGGTGLLFDASRRVYTPDQLGAESQEAFGGLDMIDISGWAYHEKTGRVGDYLTNDLGGLDELKRAAAAVHARGGRLGLYFEGYLVDRRCPLAARALPAWQIVRRDGKPMWWSGDMELFVCPGVRPWQAELSQAIAQVAAFTGADAVYVDEFGYAEPGKACWSPGHGHPVPSNPLAEERAMLDAVRRALAAQAPGTALYIEFVPADGLAGRVDAAFDLGISGDQPGRHPTKLPLYRYVFPGLASFQMVSHGIRPVPFEADDLHRCVFHGMGIWLKGRGESWFTPGFRDLARQARRLFADYGRVFRSPDCEPLLPTLRPELYANRFSAGGETIYTLYNAGGSTLAGDLLSVPFPPDTQVRELLGGAPAELRPADGNAATVLRGRVEPGSVAVFLVRPAAGFGRR
jgi:hypothetical protein